MKKQIKENLKLGVLDIAIVKIISESKVYGYEIKKIIEEKSAGLIEIPDGTLYLSLRRLLNKGYIVSEKEIVSKKRFRNYFTITDFGKEYLEIAKEAFDEVFKGATFILR